MNVAQQRVRVLSIEHQSGLGQRRQMVTWGVYRACLCAVSDKYIDLVSLGASLPYLAPPSMVDAALTVVVPWWMRSSHSRRATLQECRVIVADSRECRVIVAGSSQWHGSSPRHPPPSLLTLTSLPSLTADAGNRARGLPPLPRRYPPTENHPAAVNGMVALASASASARHLQI